MLFLGVNSSKLLWFGSLKVFVNIILEGNSSNWEFESIHYVNIIPEWYLSVNYFHLCQRCNKLYVEATIPFYCALLKGTSEVSFTNSLVTVSKDF